MNKRVLLIGGAGFIGSRFCQLSNYNCEVADRLTTGDIVRTSPRMNLPRANFDSVIFLAAEPNLAAAVANPERAYKTMTLGLHNCLERYKDSHFVYASRYATVNRLHYRAQITCLTLHMLTTLYTG
jgi:nucleoside-diphosphate-sugar epimerase